MIFLALGGCALHRGQEKSGGNVHQVPPYKPTTKPYRVKGVSYTPKQEYASYQQEGYASWYGWGDGFHRKTTAIGDTFLAHKYTAAHATWPLPAIIEIKNLENGRTLEVLLNDRGPYTSSYGPYKQKRILDVSAQAALKLGFYHKGLAKIRIRLLPLRSKMYAQWWRQQKGYKTPRGPVFIPAVYRRPGTHARPYTIAGPNTGSVKGPALHSTCQGGYAGHVWVKAPKTAIKWVRQLTAKKVTIKNDCLIVGPFPSIMHGRQLVTHLSKRRIATHLVYS